MVTVKETTSRELSGPEEIISFLQKRYGEMRPGEFAPGDAVNLISRAGLPQEFAIGDVAVFICAVPIQPFSYVLCLNSSGVEIAFQVQTANLSKRDPS